MKIINRARRNDVGNEEYCHQTKCLIEEKQSFVDLFRPPSNGHIVYFSFPLDKTLFNRIKEKALENKSKKTIKEKTQVSVDHTRSAAAVFVCYIPDRSLKRKEIGDSL